MILFFIECPVSMELVLLLQVIGSILLRSASASCLFDFFQYIFPTTDFHNKVVTPGFLVLGQSINFGSISSDGHLFRALFLCNVAFNVSIICTCRLSRVSW